LAAAVRHATISSTEPTDEEDRAFTAFHGFLRSAYPRVHATLERRVVGPRSLLYRWAGSDDGRRPVLLLAHQDVVPVEPGTESSWTHPPFAGVVADGYVWGRGAIDDKASLVAILDAVEELLAENFVPRETVYLAFGADEEIGGFDGAATIAAKLDAENVRLGIVLDEGKAITIGVVRGVDRPVAEIGIAEKGFLSLALRVEAEGGHSSRPPAATAIGILSAAIVRLEASPFPVRIDGATRAMLEALAGERSGWDRFRFANLGIFGGLLARELAADPSLQPYVRTTTAPTIFRAGIRENVLPKHAEAIVNFRILPGDSIEGVIARTREVVADGRITIEPWGRIRSEPSPVSAATGESYERLVGAIRETFPEAVVVPSLVTGYTDSRHFASIADAVHRFAPNRLEREDLPRIHGADERIAVADLERAVAFYRRWLEAGASR
jgi:carboxypeptidase PM20D1